jgi:hypothetical protein
MGEKCDLEITITLDNHTLSEKCAACLMLICKYEKDSEVVVAL